MNLFDITNEDIARLQENKIVFGLLPERDREIFEAVKTDNCVVALLSNTDIDWYPAHEFCGIYLPVYAYKIKPDYTLPSPTEEQVVQYALESKLPVDQWPEWVRNYPLSETQIIKYLQASTVPPSQWHPAAQEWARKYDGEPIWETSHTFGVWAKSCYVLTNPRQFSSFPHRLRADYGTKEPIIAQPCYKPSDVSYGPFTLEPEVCVWVECDGFRQPQCKYIWYKNKVAKTFTFCPVCGKRIEVKNERI